MNPESDRLWNDMAHAYRREKKLLPMSVREAEEAFDEAPSVAIEPAEIRAIIQSVTGIPNAKYESQDQPAEQKEVFAANSRVRLKGDPMRHGIITGRTRSGRRGVGVRYQVSFPDTSAWVPSDQLELLPIERESPIDLLQAGKLGRAIDLRRTLTHVRLTGRLADVIYSMETTNTDFYAYQFKPVLRFLLSPSNALLIADEVGLGKTIEAGLIWTELRSRFDLRRLLVLCPAVLRDKWRRELAQKIGVRADIVDASGLLRNLRDPDLAMRGFAMICSLQGARPNRNWRDAEERNSSAELATYLKSRENEDPLIDLLIIDEAHYLRNPESQTHELGRLFRPVTANLLLLSATPIHNHNQDLFTLLQLLDADTFERPEDLHAILGASRPLVEARDEILRPQSNGKLYELLEQADAHPLLRGNRQLALAKQVAADAKRLSRPDEKAQLARRLEMINPLAYVITRTRKRDVKEWRVLRDPIAEHIQMKSCESSFYAGITEFVIKYAMTRAVNERFILATPQRQMSSSMAASLRAWQRRGDNIDDFAAANREGRNGRQDEIGPLTREIIARAHEFGSVEELTLNDSKYARVREILSEFFEHNPREKIVLFSTFRETLNYLGERLASDGIVNVVMHGGIKKPKEEILQAFQEDANIQVLLSSEIGSEGIDLQFCRVLINYDLPWNPMRVEQRIGRLDRLGQPANKILIWNLFYENTIDARIYSRLYEKLDLCRQALGDFEAILGDEVRKLTTALLSDHLSPKQQEARIDQAAQALANLKHEQEELENEASHLVAYGDYILNQIRAARELNRWITGDDLLTYVTDFLRMHYPGSLCRQIDAERNDYELTLSNSAKADLEQFIRDKRLSTHSQLTRNLARPVRCTFANRTVSIDDNRTELISQFHPLVRFVSDSINQREEQLSPAVSVTVNSDDIESVCEKGIYILAAARWSVEGLQSVEKLVFAAAIVKPHPRVLDESEAERLAAAASQHGTDWFEANVQVPLEEVVKLADDELFGTLEDKFIDFVEDVRRQNEDRADLQLRNLRRHLDKQLRKLTSVRERHELFQRESLVKATEGQINALKNRIERKEVEIEKRRQVRHRSDEVLIALIRIK